MTTSLRTASIDGLSVGQLERLRAVARLDHGVAGAGEHAAGDLADGVVVLDQQDRLGARARRRRTLADGCGARGLTRGSSSVNDVPDPAVVSTSTSPSQPATNSLTIASPSPVPRPASFVVKNGSKTCGRSSGSIPVPVSATRRNA